jgi:hypothetical protein
MRQAAARGRRLRPLGDRAIRPHPIPLGWVFLGVVVGGFVVISGWSVLQVRGGADVAGAVSVGVSAAAAYVVGMLALIAAINFVSWVRKTDYLFILPADFADFRWDWMVAAAVVAGLIAGKLFWL